MMMSTILALTDFSESSINAVNQAINIASETNQQLIVGHRIENQTVLSFDVESGITISDHDDTYGVQINTWMTDCKEKEVPLKLEVFSEAVSDYVAASQKNPEVSMVVMGSNGKNRKNTWGSCTLSVVSQGTVPILVLKNNHKKIAFESIAYASGFAPSDKVVFSTFITLLNRFTNPTNTTIHLVAVDTFSFYSQPSVIMYKSMEEFEELAKPYNSEIHFYKDYSIHSGIRHLSEDLNINVIAMANRKSKSLKHFLLGNETIETMDTIDYPIIILPE